MHAAKLKIPVPELEPDVLRVLLDHDWPGNVRELSNALERAMVLSHGGRVGIGDLPAAVVRGAPETAPPLPEGELSLKRHAVAAQGEVIREALKRAGGNRRRAAALLGISVRSLFYKLKTLGLPES